MRNCCSNMRLFSCEQNKVNNMIMKIKDYKSSQLLKVILNKDFRNYSVHIKVVQFFGC